MKIKTQEMLGLTVNDALANLSALAEMKIDAKEPIGIVKKRKLVIEDEEFSYRTIDWFLTENAEELIENVKESYQTLYDYIKKIYEKDFIVWDDPGCRKGFQAIMVMACEAANKVDRYLDLLPEQPTLEKINECYQYKQLKEFYLEKITKKFSEGLEGEEPWKDEWAGAEKSLLLDVEKSGLKDFEMLKKDENYELFYLVDEEEKPFLDPHLIRNIKLFCEYDEEALKKIEEDPLLKVRIFLDRDFQEASKQILNSSYKLIGRYFDEKLQKNTENEFISYINEAVFALFLAGNPKNLITQSFHKNSIEYFYDFQHFLREALQSDEYQKLIVYAADDKRTKCLLRLVHSLCRGLYLRTASVKQEMTGFIHLLIRKGDEFRKFTYPRKASFWNTVLENDESIQVLLNSLPSGPLMKLLDAVREEKPTGFDPIRQDNVPMKVLEIHHNMNEIKVLRCPCPTKQQTISHAQVIEEFKGFLQSFEGNDKYLFINLQDRTSFKETARCKAVEGLQKRFDFRNRIVIVSLDKHSDFYHQSGIYLSLNDTKEFLKEFKNQLFSGKNTALFVSRELAEFADKAFEVFHKHFFDDKNVFTRKDRSDFIEIFYNFLILKIIELQNPEVLSFTCKDSVDEGAAQTAAFYAFLKLIKNEKFEKENEDFFRWLIYSSAILVRERSVNPTVLIRSVSALNSMEFKLLTHKEKIMKAVSFLYDPSFIKALSIIEH